MKKETCEFYCEFCENKDLVFEKLKEHKRELLEAKNVFIKVKIVIALHCICDIMIENAGTH